MKQIILFFVVLIATSQLIAQSPSSINYQAVLRDATGVIKASQAVNLGIDIISGSADGTSVYSETHMANTNEFGLINLEIGTGTTMDDFNGIDWGSAAHFVKITVDGVLMGTSQLLSVPYALYAKKSGDSFSGDYNDLNNKPNLSEQDPVYGASVASGITDAGSAKVITDDERTKLNNAITVTGAITAGNLISYDGNNWVATDLDVSSSHSTSLTGNNQAINNLQPYQTVNFCIALQGVFPSRNGLDPFIAEIMMFGGNFAPRGWALCDGQLLAISQFQALFSLLGTTYGGDGRTTFGLPDLRGRVAMHPGNGPGLKFKKFG